MDDISTLPINVPIMYGGRLCMVVQSGQELDLLVWVRTGPNSGFWEA